MTTTTGLRQHLLVHSRIRSQSPNSERMPAGVSALAPTDVHALSPWPRACSLPPLGKAKGSTCHENSLLLRASPPGIHFAHSESTIKRPTWLAPLLLALGFRLRLLDLDVLAAAEPQVHVPGAPAVPAGGPGAPPAVCLLRWPVHRPPHLVAAPLAPPVVISIVLHLGNHAVPNLRGTRMQRGPSSCTEFLPTRARELLRAQGPRSFRSSRHPITVMLYPSGGRMGSEIWEALMRRMRAWN